MVQRIFLLIPTLLSHPQVSGEDQCRHDRENSCSPSLPHPDVVHSSTADAVSTTQTNFVDVGKGPVNSPLRQEGSQHAGETEIDGISLVRRQYESKGIPEHTTRVLFESWRTSTHAEACAVRSASQKMACILSCTENCSIFPYCNGRFGIFICPNSFVLC